MPVASTGEGEADEDAVAEHPPRSWGLAARGATIEAGTPEFDFQLTDKIEVWADDAARIYEQAVAAQWDPGDRDPVECAVRARRRSRGRGRAGDDVPHRERNGGADRSEPVHRTVAPAFPRSDAGARRSSGRRGPPHRGVHAARQLKRSELGRRRLAGRRRSRRWSRSRLRHRVVPALGARRRDVSLAAVVHRAVRARSRDGRP